MEKNKDIKKPIIIKGRKKEIFLKKTVIVHYHNKTESHEDSLLKLAEHPSSLLPESQTGTLSSFLMGSRSAKWTK
jgi:hypothetical protein